jgi:hypothetical protein
MVRRRKLVLGEKEREELVACRDHDPNPQMRERAAALVKIADRMSVHAVSQTGLLRRRKPDTVYDWLNWYEAGGLGELRRHLQGGSQRGRLRRRTHRGAGEIPPGEGGSYRVGAAIRSPSA